MADATKRNLLRHETFEVLRLFLIQTRLAKNRRLDEAGAEGVDPDLARFEIGRPSPRKGPQGGFRCGVNAECFHPFVGGDRGIE